MAEISFLRAVGMAIENVVLTPGFKWSLMGVSALTTFGGTAGVTAWDVEKKKKKDKKNKKKNNKGGKRDLDEIMAYGPEPSNATSDAQSTTLYRGLTAQELAELVSEDPKTPLTVRRSHNQINSTLGLFLLVPPKIHGPVDTQKYFERQCELWDCSGLFSTPRLMPEFMTDTNASNPEATMRFHDMSPAGKDESNHDPNNHSSNSLKGWNSSESHPPVAKGKAPFNNTKLVDFFSRAFDNSNPVSENATVNDEAKPHPSSPRPDISSSFSSTPHAGNEFLTFPLSVKFVRPDGTVSEISGRWVTANEATISPANRQRLSSCAARIARGEDLSPEDVGWVLEMSRGGDGGSRNGGVEMTTAAATTMETARKVVRRERRSG